MVAPGKMVSPWEEQFETDFVRVKTVMDGSVPVEKTADGERVTLR
jgi:hypothetical protein